MVHRFTDNNENSENCYVCTDDIKGPARIIEAWERAHYITLPPERQCAPYLSLS